MNPNAPSTIQQIVNLAPGSQYKLSFALRSNTSCGDKVKTGFVSASGALQQAFSYDETSSNQQWQKREYTFTAAQAVTQVQLGSTTQGNCGPVIDAVRLVQIL